MRKWVIFFDEVKIMFIRLKIFTSFGMNAAALGFLKGSTLVNRIKEEVLPVLLDIPVEQAKQLTDADFMVVVEPSANPSLPHGIRDPKHVPVIVARMNGVPARPEDNAAARALHNIILSGVAENISTNQEVEVKTILKKDGEREAPELKDRVKGKINHNSAGAFGWRSRGSTNKERERVS